MARTAEPRLNLTKATVLLLQNNHAELDILGQVFIGFGVKAIRKCVSPADALDAISGAVSFDLIVVDCDMPGGAGYDFVAQLRRMEQNPNRLAPVLLISGHTVPSSITRARDCGANFVVAKPITPKVMFDRVMWLAREARQFVVADAYAGPDRRHRSFGPPPGTAERRHDAAPADGAAEEIDTMANPKRAAV